MEDMVKKSSSFAFQSFTCFDDRGKLTNLTRETSNILKPKEIFYSISHVNVFRGFHYTLDPSNKKIVHLLYGSIIDYTICIDKSSETYGLVESHILSKNSMNDSVYVAPLHAHGFYATEESCVAYITNYSHLESPDQSFNWKSIDYAWPFTTPIESERDNLACKFDDIWS